ncbi:MAG: peptidoglycan-binding protein [Acidimicrobiia bacterium]
MTEFPTLRAGSRDPALTALQDRLLHLGLLQHHDPLIFCEETERSVRSFQVMRGLRADGIAGPQTWSSLDESGCSLGERLLSVRSPLLRGDDVLDLQLRLDRLGFRVGRVDGILGPETEAAIREFQRNVSIAVDGICGPDTIVALNRFHHLAGGRISEISELERFHAHAESGVRICLAHSTGLPSSFWVTTPGGRHKITESLDLGQDPESDHDNARAANSLCESVDLFVGYRSADVPALTLSYFELGDARSAVGRALAEATQFFLPAVGIQGMSGPLLRETRMPALLVESPVDTPPEQHSHVMSALYRAIDECFRSPDARGANSGA